MIYFTIIVVVLLTTGILYYYSYYNQKKIGIRFIAKHTNRDYKKLYKEMKHLEYKEVYDLYFDCLDRVKNNIKSSINEII